MGATSHRTLGIAIAVVFVGAGVALTLRSEPEAPEPEVRTAPTRAAIERELRDGGVLRGPGRAPFQLNHTGDWRPLEAGALGDGEPRPVAGLRRSDNSGLLTVSVRDAVPGGLGRLRETLPADLERRFDDFRLEAIREVRVAAGPALYASFVREESGQVQTMLVVPDGDRRSYQVDAVIRSEARDTAAEVGVMLGTFDVPGR